MGAFELGIAEDLHVGLGEVRCPRVPTVHEEDHVLQVREMFVPAISAVTFSVSSLSSS